MVRFLHTGDWHLGMTRRFLSEGVQERFSQSRFDSIKELGRIAKREDCQFMVVCGDVFDSNLVDKRTVLRAMEALKAVHVPVYILPGNHDLLNEASVFRSATFQEHKPEHVHVIENSDTICFGKGVEIVGIPCTSKHPTSDLITSMIGELESTTDKLRICVAHGMTDNLVPNLDNPALISLQAAEHAISNNKIQYLALGDRHSSTKVGNSGRIWYGGSPEPTNYTEVRAGYALVTTLKENEISTTEIEVGKWKFIELEHVDLNSDEDIDALETRLETSEDKEVTIIKLRLFGAISLTANKKLEELISRFQDIFGAVEIRSKDLVIVPDDADFTDLGFSGFASETVNRLKTSASESGSNTVSSRDALALLVRLAGSAK